MGDVNSKILDASDPRYWHQNAQIAIRDVYDALTELITNADDRYVLLKEQGVLQRMGVIEIEVERRRKGKPSIIRVRDFADGMTADDMDKKLARLAGGRADSALSVTPKNEWDIAAGVVLVTEAGGMVTDLSGAPYTFNQSDTLVNGVVAASKSAYPLIMNLVETVSKVGS